jgi:hypothetical protein
MFFRVIGIHLPKGIGSFLWGGKKLNFLQSAPQSEVQSGFPSQFCKIYFLHIFV